MHDTQPGDGGSASSTQGPRDPGEELHQALNEQTRLNEELNQLRERQKAEGQTKEDAVRYNTTIMNLLGQLVPRVMNLCAQAAQYASSLQSSASASSASMKPSKPDSSVKPVVTQPPKAILKPPEKVESGKGKATGLINPK